MRVELGDAQVRVVVEGRGDDGRRDGVVATEEHPALARIEDGGERITDPGEGGSRVAQRNGKVTGVGHREVGEVEAEGGHVGLEQVGRTTDLTGTERGALALVHLTFEGDAVEHDRRASRVGPARDERGVSRTQHSMTTIHLVETPGGPGQA
jgi:hypothetical protein